MKVDLRGANGHVIATVDAKVFVHNIAGVQYRLVFHEERTKELVITHPESGYRVARVGFGVRFGVYKGDDRAAVRGAMNDLINKYGAAKVRAALEQPDQHVRGTKAC